MDITKPIWIANREPSGPFSLGQVRAMWSAGTLTLTDHYSQEGAEAWLPLSEIVPVLENAAPPAPAQSPAIEPTRVEENPISPATSTAMPASMPQPVNLTDEPLFKWAAGFIFFLVMCFAGWIAFADHGYRPPQRYPTNSAETERNVNLGFSDGKDAAQKANASHPLRDGNETIRSAATAADARGLSGQERLNFIVAFSKGYKEIRP